MPASYFASVISCESPDARANGEADATARIQKALATTDDVKGTTTQIGDAIAAAC